MEPNISKEIRANLKRLCPYVGSNIPDSVRENARDLWWDCYDPAKSGHWQWDDGSGVYQCELELCDLDAETVDPAGYVAIRPIGQGKYALTFVLDKKYDPGDVTFSSILEAKRFLDTLLAADTPEIPLEGAGSSRELF
jgi:hypothetical protein